MSSSVRPTSCWPPEEGVQRDRSKAKPFGAASQPRPPQVPRATSPRWRAPGTARLSRHLHAARYDARAVAALQAPVILMSQNRQAARDRLAAGLDYEINLKAEIEIMALHDKLDRIRVEHLEGVLREQSDQLRTLLQHVAQLVVR